MARHGDKLQAKRRLNRRQAAARYGVEEVRGAEALKAAGEEWRALAKAALSPNPTLEPFYHLAALAQLAGAGDDVRTMLVWHTLSARRGKEVRQLVGLLACVRPRGLARLDRGPAGTWFHDYGFLATPLLHRDHAEEALAAFLDWYGRTRGNRFLFRMVPTEGAFAQTLERACARLGLAAAPVGRIERAVYRADADAQTYMERALSRGRRGRLRRQRRRLAGQGTLTVRRFSGDEDPEHWFSRFEVLEAAGWKGRAGTAVASRPQTRAMFRAIVRALADDGRLLFWSMELDGHPVAMTMGMRGHERAWLFKMAYDEAQARFSPGVQLALDIMDWGAGESAIVWIDSCAGPDHPMWNHLWHDRLALADVLVACRPGAGLSLGAARALERVRRRLRAAAGALYHRLSGRRAT